MKTGSYFSKTLLVILGLFLGATNSIKAAESDLNKLIQSIPNVQLTDKTQFVSDQAHLLSPPDIDSLNKAIFNLKKRGVQMAVVTLPSLKGYPIEEVANELFRSWGIGSKKTNRGLLILIAQRKIRIEVGYGLEGSIPDAEAFRIQEDIIIPAFKRAKYGQGLMEAVGEVEHLVGASNGGKSKAKTNKIDYNDAIFIIIAFIYFLIVFNYLFDKNTKIKLAKEKYGFYGKPLIKSKYHDLMFERSIFLFLNPWITIPYWLIAYSRLSKLLNGRNDCPFCGKQNSYVQAPDPHPYLRKGEALEMSLQSVIYSACVCQSCGNNHVFGENGPRFSKHPKCPKCGFHTLRMESSQYDRYGAYYIIYKCDNCEERKKTKVKDDDRDTTGWATGAFLGSILGSGGSSWGGGSFGGSWGGGSSGGGGSTGSW